MANFLFISQRTKLSLFLNTSFLFLFCFYLTLHLSPSNSHFLQSKIPSTTITITPSLILEESNGDNCGDIHKYHDYKAKCLYVSSNKGCKSEGYIDYLQLFYCICGRYVILGYTILTLWLIVLFYLLGNTAANYFCSSLESLSKILKLSPTVAGVTLLSLGNGAPDVFSSIVSFMGNGSDGVGFNSILGGAFFVSSIVVGIICICISPRNISVDKSSFIKDIIFFLLSLFCLLVMVIVGRINIWGAMGFVLLYFIYVLVVSTTQFWWKNDREVNLFVTSSPLPITKKNYAPVDLEELGTPLLCYIDDEKPILIEKGSIEDGDDQKSRRNCFGSDFDSSSCDYFVRFLYILELPLSLPRRLTIPVVCEEKWSKPFAVISVTLAPILLTFLWRGDMVSKESLMIYLASVLVGILCGIIAFVTTNMSNPPKRFLLPWLVGGFLMSVTWSYIIAEELVALLVSLGSIFGINPSILGLTLLAWGNSIGDLIANIAMAMNGEQDGAQIAISGCYAGPIFNILLGLGFPLVLSCWSEYPSSYVIPRDPSLYQTIGFLMGGLLWALVILPRRKMILDRVLGGGLLAIYLCFLSVRLAQTLGAVPLQNSLVFFKP